MPWRRLGPVGSRLRPSSRAKRQGLKSQTTRSALPCDVFGRGNCRCCRRNALWQRTLRYVFRERRICRRDGGSRRPLHSHGACCKQYSHLRATATGRVGPCARGPAATALGPLRPAAMPPAVCFLHCRHASPALPPCLRHPADACRRRGGLHLRRGRRPICRQLHAIALRPGVILGLNNINYAAALLHSQLYLLLLHILSIKLKQL